jgi:hypothetical protein
MGAERILICTVVFILAVVIPTCVGQTIPSGKNNTHPFLISHLTCDTDACLQASSLNGTYTLSKQTSGRDVCFRISPLLPKGKQASSISLKFTNFSFAGQSKLHIYSSSFVNENKVTVYSGVLGKEEAPPPELTIKAPAVLLYAKGSGERSFTVVYKVSDGKYYSDFFKFPSFLNVASLCL